MLKDVTFGSYYPARSFVHSMDPRFKILAVIAYIVFIFLAKTFYAFLPLLAFLAVAVAASRVPLKSVLRSIKGIIFLLVFMAVVHVFLGGNGDVVEISGVKLQFWIFSITYSGLIGALFLMCRLTMLVMGTCILTLTTAPMELTEGIERLLAPLKYVKFPVHELALIMSIALRFIPTLMEETDRIVNAQKSRGADFESGNLVKRVKAMVPVLIPLLVGAFRRAEELGDAMDSRCYSGAKGRTKYKKLRLTYRDAVGFIVLSAVGAAVIIMYCTLPALL